MEKRVALWDCVIVGFLGIVLAINASLDRQHVGTSVLLIASALAFGFFGFVFVRK